MEHLTGLLIAAIAFYFYGDDSSLIDTLMEILKVLIGDLNTVEDLEPIIRIIV